MKTTTTETDAALAALGFTLESSPPTGQVDGDWPCIVYAVTLSLNGKPVLTVNYRLGIGHVDIKAFQPSRFSGQILAMLEAWKCNPSARFKDQGLLARAACALAVHQKVAPELSNVLYSLLSNGEAFFQASSFEDWANDFGYDKDSRKAEAIYRACDAIGRKLAANVPTEVLIQAREILKDH